MDSSASALEKLKGCGSQGDFHGVIQLMQKHQNITDLQGRGCAALWKMIRPTRDTSYENSNKKNEIAIAEAGGIEVVLGALKTHRQHPRVLAEALFAIRCLGSNENSQVKIAAAGGIESILNAMKQHAQHEAVARNWVWCTSGSCVWEC